MQTYNMPTNFKVFIAFLMAVLIWTGGISAVNIIENKKLKSMVDVTAEEAMKDVSKLKSNLETLTKEHQDVLKEYEGYKEKHNPNSGDIDKKAIALYIKTNYRKVPKELVESITNNVIKKSSKHSISYELVLAIIEVESDFNPLAVSNKEARGLMQVRADVWGKKLGLTDRFTLHEVDIGIESGIIVIKHYLDGHDGGKKGDLATALFLYVGKNKEYVNKVLYALGNFTLFRASI
jgi:hypothetical protein